MNILIISGSPRKGGNTELLAEAFAKGAAERLRVGASAGMHHHVEIVSVRDYKVNPCLGCNACANERHESLLSDGRVQPSVAEGNACFQTDGICAQKDDMAMIYEKMSQADMLVIASPVYFYGISAQLKAVIDRFHNPIRDSFHIKKMALLLVGAASLPELFDAILTEYNLCLRFFNIEDAGKVLVRGVKDKGDIKNTDALNEAYILGCSI
jgi:multimeric flavodoxin WrbA